jgi:hypothetical protein
MLADAASVERRKQDSNTMETHMKFTIAARHFSHCKSAIAEGERKEQNGGILTTMQETSEGATFAKMNR